MAVTLKGGMGSSAFATLPPKVRGTVKPRTGPRFGTFGDEYRLTRWRKTLADLLYRAGFHERIVGRAMRRTVGHNAPCDLRDALFDAAVMGVCHAAAFWRPGRGGRVRFLCVYLVKKSVRRAMANYWARNRSRNVPAGDEIGDYLDAIEAPPLGHAARADFTTHEDLALVAHARRMAALNGTAAKVVRLRMEGHSFAELAGRTGLDEWTVREITQSHVRGIRTDLGVCS